MKLCPASTGFGYIILGGHKYDHDIVVYPDGSTTRREKTLSKPEADLYNHTPLSRRELDFYLSKVDSVDCVIIGTGQRGAMKVTPEAMEKLAELEKQGVRVFIDITPRIVEMCHELEKCRKPLIVIHVTC
ncbi:Mth938-like domain-containing protein [Hyperthermus butylicus]|uniref:Uncharacterized protein n=1 Tax=Hyperthermus butylicus (strain DSM 5456 / JCM 9403 / PLM1-5) TaxID=415426 RepID=A2BJT8_HYPBU|nr:Mth938-like domain-containing protein [Hyperthermus butylicus]ABM80249.1 hypothetical protein Hbut_0378 [Hyperthermus butylicus DSM 5456]